MSVQQSTPIHYKPRHIVTSLGYLLYKLAPSMSQSGQNVDGEDSVVSYARESSSHLTEH